MTISFSSSMYKCPFSLDNIIQVPQVVIGSVFGIYQAAFFPGRALLPGPCLYLLMLSNSNMYVSGKQSCWGLHFDFSLY